MLWLLRCRSALRLHLTHRYSHLRRPGHSDLRTLPRSASGVALRGDLIGGLECPAVGVLIPDVGVLDALHLAMSRIVLKGLEKLRCAQAVELPFVTQNARP